MSSFDGTVVSTVADSVDRLTDTRYTDDSQDRTLQSAAIAERLGAISPTSTLRSERTVGNTSPTSSTTSGNSQLRKPREVIRNVYVQDVGWASQVRL